MADISTAGILLSTKNFLGIPDDLSVFDSTLVADINSVFSILNDLGVGGSNSPYKITGYDESWSSFISDAKNIEDVKTYMFMKVRMMFDPPISSNVIETSEFHDMTIDIDISVDAVNEYAKSILGRYPENNYEFSRALEMKILEETKSLANSVEK